MKAETVVLLNKIYCWVRAVGWLLGALLGFKGRGMAGEVYAQQSQLWDSAGFGPDRLVGLYTVIGFMGVLFCFMNIILARAPMTKKWWSAHIINHVVGILECCCLPLGLPLLILWLRPDVKALFDESLPPQIPYTG